MILKEFTRLRNACIYSWSGIRLSWKDAGAFRSEICLTPFIAIGAICFTHSKTDLAIILGSWLLVLVAELLNTAIEAVTDLACGGEYHLLAKKAKDCGSAAVTIAILIFVASGILLIF